MARVPTKNKLYNPSVQLKDFKKYYRIPADSDLVYKALTNENTIRLWTGEAATMNEVPGSVFSLWGGSITGTNIEFEPGRKIVQRWDFGDQETPSIVTIILHPDKKYTSAEVRHTHIPDEDYEDICTGWTDTYMASLIDFYTG